MSIRSLRVLGWIAVYLVLLEVGLEVRAVRRGWDALLLGSPVEEAADGGAWGPTEAFPFRSPVVEPRAPAGTWRLWVASSSYGEDLQLPPDRIFPNLLAEALAERGLACQPLNASVAGYDVDVNRAELAALGETWGPDVVVLYQMSNDIDEISALGAAAELEGDAPKLAGGDAGAGAPLFSWADRLYEETTVYKHLKTQVASRVTRGRVLADELGPAGVRAFEARVRAFLAQVRALGAQPVFCTFATSHVRANLAETPEEYELNLLRFNPYLSLAGWLDAVERCNQVLVRVAAEESVPLVDVAAAVGGRSEHFRDFWHFRASGHELVSRALVGPVAAALEGRRPGGGRSGGRQ